MDLRQGGGNAHGHVHHRAQGADDDAAHQQAPQTDGRAGLPQLQQGLHVVDAQAVDAGQSLGQQAEQQGQGGARHCAQHGAHGLFPDAAYDGQAYHRHIGADDKRHQQRVGTLHQGRQQHAEQAHQRHRQGHQGFDPRPAAHGHRCRDEQHQHDAKGQQTVEFIHRGVDGAVGIGRDQDGGPVPGLQRPAVQGPHIVIHLHLLALIVAGADGDQQQLLAAITVVGGRVLLRGIGEDLVHGGAFVIRAVLGLVGLHRHRSRQQPRRDQHHQRRRQHDARPFILPQPGGGAGPLRFFLHIGTGPFGS